MTRANSNGTRAFQIASDLALGIGMAYQYSELIPDVILTVKGARAYAENLGIADEVKAAALTHFGINLTNWGWGQ